MSVDHSVSYGIQTKCIQKVVSSFAGLLSALFHSIVLMGVIQAHTQPRQTELKPLGKPCRRDSSDAEHRFPVAPVLLNNTQISGLCKGLIIRPTHHITCH